MGVKVLSHGVYESSILGCFPTANMVKGRVSASQSVQSVVVDQKVRAIIFIDLGIMVCCTPL